MPNFENYIFFKNKKNTLVNLINESSSIISDISLTQYAEGLRQLGQKLDNDTFRIQIVGTFKNGKSTFINALLGKDVLPTRALPCTAVINEIKYGETPKAILNFRNPLPETLLSDIPEATLEHMRAHQMTNVPPMEIVYDRISDYVTIPIDGKPEEISLKSPYLSVELFYPLDLLREGVEIIDSPGLNENDERTAVTLEYLDKADAIIFLLDATKACAKDEMETIQDILVPKGFDDIFFVVNRFDLIATTEQADIKQFVENKVQQYTTNDIFYLSALKAVEGKVEEDENKLNQSGFLPFETKLSEFLTRDKGKIKLVKPAKELKGILATEALFKAIPSQREQLSTNLQILQARYESIAPQLVNYESQKETFSKTVKLKVENKENAISRAISSQYRTIANQIPAWITAYKPKSSPGVFARQRDVEKVADEICKHLSCKVKENFGQWNQDVLVPLVEESAQEIFDSSEQTLKCILDGIDQLQSEFSGTVPVQDTSSGWTRVLGVAGICCGFASGASLLTGRFDIGTVAKALAVDIGVGTGLLLLGVTNPILAIAGVVAVVWNAILGGQKAVVMNLKTQLATEITNSIINNSDTKSSEIIAKIDKEFQKTIATATNAIDIKINDLKTQVESVLKEKKQGEANANQRLQLLAQSETKLQRICGELDSFVISLIENH